MNHAMYTLSEDSKKFNKRAGDRGKFDHLAFFFFPFFVWSFSIGRDIPSGFNLTWILFPYVFSHLYERVRPSVRHTRVEFLRNGPNLNKMASGIREIIQIQIRGQSARNTSNVWLIWRVTSISGLTDVNMVNPPNCHFLSHRSRLDGVDVAAAEVGFEAVLGRRGRRWSPKAGEAADESQPKRQARRHPFQGNHRKRVLERFRTKKIHNRAITNSSSISF